MPGFTPGRRWQPPFYPFKREPFGYRLLASGRADGQRAAVWLPDVRQLPAARNRLHLLDGMSQRSAQRPLRRLDRRTLLCR